MTGRGRVSLFAFLAAPLLAAGPAQAEDFDLWPCGSRNGREVTFNTHFWRDAEGKPIPRPPDAPRSPFPLGGAYGSGGAGANLTFPGDELWRLGPFDVVCHAVVINGKPIDPNLLHDPHRVIEYEGSTGVLFWPEYYSGFILRGIPLDAWKQGAALQTFGTERDDTLTGTDGADVLVPGAGRDLVAPGAGDDAILFTSGTLTIADDPPNTGTDHIELSRFTLDDLAFTAQGMDLIIATPDGFIRIVNQLATPEGQVERLRLSNRYDAIWVDAATLRESVLAGQQP